MYLLRTGLHHCTPEDAEFHAEAESATATIFFVGFLRVIEALKNI
jgi:hypothetical protein